MTYDSWKTTDPREYEREEEDQPSEEELVYEQLWQAQRDARDAEEVAAARIKELEASLLECLEYFKGHYDVRDGDYGEPAPNKEMQLGTMIEETLYGIQF